MKLRLYFFALFLFSFSGLQAKPELVLQFGHSDQVTAVSFAPDSAYGLTAAKDRTVRLWNSHNQSVHRVWRVPAIALKVAFAREGHFVLSDGTKVTAFSIRNESPLWSWPAPIGTRIRDLCAAPDGSFYGLLFHTKEKTSSLWGLDNKGAARQLAASRGQWEIFTNNGTLIGAGDGKGNLALWEMATGKALGFWRAHEGAVRALAFAPDGKTLVSGGADCRVCFWDTNSKAALRTLTAHLKPINNLVFTSDGTTLAVQNGEQIKFWNLTDGAQAAILRATLEPVAEKVEFAFSGDTIVTNEWRHFDWRSGQEINPQSISEREKKIHSLSPAHFVFCPPGGGLISAQINGDTSGWLVSIARWSAAPQLLIPNLGDLEDIYDFAATRDGSIIAFTTPNYVSYWQRDGTRKSVAISEDFWTNLAFAPDGKTLAITSEDSATNAGGIVTFRDVPSGRTLRTVKKVGEQTHGLRYSPDGKRLAVCATVYEAIPGNPSRMTGGAAVFILRVADGKVETILRGYRGTAFEPAFSPDGKLLVASSLEKQVRVWDVSRNPPRQLWKLPFPEGETGIIKFSPDGKTMAAAGSGYIRLWDVQTRRELRAWRAHEGYINALDWAPHGKVLVTGSDDGTIALWNVASSTPRGSEERARCSTFSVWEKNDATVEWLAWSPQGEFACSPGAEKYLRWRDGAVLKTATEVPHLRRDDLVVQALRGQ